MRSARRKEKAGPAPAVDLGPLEESIGYLLRRAQVAVFQRFFELFAEADVRPAQYSVLTVIERNPGLSQTRLADALGIKKTNLVAMIDALEERGLARRAPTETDRRFHALFLTAKGMAFVARLHRVHAALDSQLSQALDSSDRRRLLDGLRRLTAT